MMNNLKIFILTHGRLGDALKNVLRHMVGDKELKDIVSVPLIMDMKREDYYHLVDEQIKDEEILFLTDIPGGTPDIIAKMIIKNRNRGIVISGVNLPMIINIMRKNEFTHEEQFIEKLISSGKNGIQKFYNQN